MWEHQVLISLPTNSFFMKCLRPHFFPFFFYFFFFQLLSSTRCWMKETLWLVSRENKKHVSHQAWPAHGEKWTEHRLPALNTLQMVRKENSELIIFLSLVLPLLLFIPDERVNFLLRKDDRIGNRKATRKGFYLRHLLAYYVILGQFPKGRCTFILWGVEECFESVMECFFHQVSLRYVGLNKLNNRLTSIISI